MADALVAHQWFKAHADLGIEADPAILDQLTALWGEGGRYYHSLSHLEHGLTALEPYGREAALARLVWFFHDAVYVVGRGDNEERSAEWFIAYAKGRGLDEEHVSRGARLILLTKDHQGAVTDDPLWPIINDVDLGVFGASREAYDTYANNVWREYQAVATRQQFVLGRLAFMSAFKSRPIYRTDGMKAREGVARVNIEAEITRLREEAYLEGWLQR
jgi:predicted metal-dependent HD superfamily phosphohydrolase